MSARRPLQPLSPLAANIGLAYLNGHSKVGGDDDGDLTHGSGSVYSGLTSLENDAQGAIEGDDFDQLMLQNARDEKRLRDALRGNIQPFRNARTHPRVGLTLENLERNEAHAGVRGGLRSPSSSSGASDPAVRPPVEWGRKAKVRKNWLRTITADTEQQDNSIGWPAPEETPRDTEGEAGTQSADLPRPSVEDSPLSRKSSLHGTPVSTRRRKAYFDREPDWDFTLDFNEASIIASTPFIPRNTSLDDIRQREIDSLKEQALTTNRLDKIRESSPEETRRPRSSSQEAQQVTNGMGSSESPRRNSSLPIYKKRSESAGVVDPVPSTIDQNGSRPAVHKREDSQNLLRRLARVSSNTPSPGSGSASRQRASSGEKKDRSTQATTKDPSQPISEPAWTSENVKFESKQPDSSNEPQIKLTEPEPEPEPIRQIAPVDVDVTPMPSGQSLLDAKTPVVTGAWIDTPGPPTARRPIEDSSRPVSRSPAKRNLGRGSPQKGKGPRIQEETGEPSRPREIARPHVAGSALEAIVEEAKANGRKPRHEDAYGDSTIDSLEDIIHPGAGDDTNDLDEDTLQGLALPNEPPKNEAERQRQKELAHLHKMNQRLRAARTSIRDASRGMRRVEHRVENIEEGKEGVQDCPCASSGQCSPWATTWNGFKRSFYNPGSQTRYGLTWLGIATIALFVWFILETLACEKYCHKLYASRMVGFGVDMTAPRYPFVIPTLLYRKLLRPTWNVVSWFCGMAHNGLFEDETLRGSATVIARRISTTILQQSRMQETFEPDLSIGDDEVI